MGSFLTNIFSKKPKIGNELIEKEIAIQIVTVSMSLGSTFVHNSKSQKVIDSRLNFYVDEFIYIFLFCLSRSAFANGGKKAESSIFACVTDYVIQTLAISADSNEKKQRADYYLDSLLDARKWYIKSDKFITSSDGLIEDTLLWLAATRIADTGDVDDIDLASNLINAGLKTLKLDAYVVRILNNG